MPANLATVGSLQIDSVVAANGDIGLNFAGGNGGYSAVGARLWAGSCKLIAQAPENFPAEWLDEMAQNGIDTRGVTRLPGFKPLTNEWFFYQPDGTRRDYVYTTLADIATQGFDLPREPGTSLHLEPLALARLIAAIDAASTGRVEPMPQIDAASRTREIAGLVSDVAAIHLAPSKIELHSALAKKLKEMGKLVSLDPGHYVKGLKPESLAEILQHVTIFAPSEREVYEFRGPCDLEQAASDFAEMGPAIVVIKLGLRGALVFQRHNRTFDRVPVFPARTLDPTGCGDSFCGGFLAGFMETGDAVEAARYGTIAASFTVEGFGVTYALRFTRNDADHRLNMLRSGAMQN